MGEWMYYSKTNPDKIEMYYSQTYTDVISLGRQLSNKGGGKNINLGSSLPGGYNNKNI